jgi:hypothetical protein
MIDVSCNIDLVGLVAVLLAAGQWLNFKKG